MKPCASATMALGCLVLQWCTLIEFTVGLHQETSCLHLSNAGLPLPWPILRGTDHYRPGLIDCSLRSWQRLARSKRTSKATILLQNSFKYLYLELSRQLRLHSWIECKLSSKGKQTVFWEHSSLLLRGKAWQSLLSAAVAGRRFYCPCFCLFKIHTSHDLYT